MVEEHLEDYLSTGWRITSITGAGGGGTTAKAGYIGCGDCRYFSEVLVLLIEQIVDLAGWIETQSAVTSLGLISFQRSPPLLLKVKWEDKVETK